jgi:putative addiction module CopG family antidote
MIIRLLEHREQFVRDLVQRGRYASEDEVIDQAVRLLQVHEEAERARVLEGIRQGLEDMRAGRGQPAEQVSAEIRREFNLDPEV